jgi:acetoin utilization deacetylase AcuC-like enzyme
MFIIPIAVIIIFRIVSSYKPIIFTSESFSKHRSNSYHPECPERVQNCISKLKHRDDIILKIPSAETSPGVYQTTMQLIRRAHGSNYMNFIYNLCRQNIPYVDPWDEDTYLSKDSFHQCILAQSAWIDGVNCVVNDKKTAFALVRPPGHHACTNKSMGFCIFNFAVVAGLYGLDYIGLDRVAILDFDVYYLFCMSYCSYITSIHFRFITVMV